jgi:cation diffusion facilitator family transporter
MNESAWEKGARDRHDEQRRVLLVVLVLNLVVAVAKLLGSVLVGSVALAADGIHSLLDSASNVVGLTGLRVASAPPDAGHPYGHRKFEVIASLAIGVLILLAALEIGRRAVAGFLGAPAPTIGAVGWSVGALTLVVNVFVATWEARVGRRLASAILLADARHTMSDVLATALVLASFGFCAWGVPLADPVAAVLVLGVIALAAWRIFRSGIDVLVDGARLADERVRAVVRDVAGVCDVRRVRSRGLERAVELDLVIHVDAGLSVADGHAIADAVEEAVRGAWPEVADIVVHVEPDTAHDKTPSPVEGRGG